MKYRYAPDVEEIARNVILLLGLNHIDIRRLGFIRSYGSKSNAIARCHALSKALQVGLQEPAGYVIEVISERYDKLSEEEKIKTIIHELLHIPKTFGGGFRHHDYVNRRRVNKLYKEYMKKFISINSEE